LLLLALIPEAPHALAGRVTISKENVVQVNGEPVFPIGFTLAAPPGAKTPAGDDVYRELKTSGAVSTAVGRAQANGAPPPRPYSTVCWTVL